MLNREQTVYSLPIPLYGVVSSILVKMQEVIPILSLFAIYKLNPFIQPI